MNNQLIEIHNALCSIHTKGEDTITMAKCLMTLRQIIQTQNEEESKDE